MYLMAISVTCSCLYVYKLWTGMFCVNAVTEMTAFVLAQTPNQRGHVTNSGLLLTVARLPGMPVYRWCHHAVSHTGMYVCMHKHVPHAERLGSCHPGWSSCELDYQCIIIIMNFKWKWRYLFGFIGCLPGLRRPEVQWDTSLIVVFCLLSTRQEWCMIISVWYSQRFVDSTTPLPDEVSQSTLSLKRG